MASIYVRPLLKSLFIAWFYSHPVRNTFIIENTTWNVLNILYCTVHHKSSERQVKKKTESTHLEENMLFALFRTWGSGARKPFVAEMDVTFQR